MRSLISLVLVALGLVACGSDASPAGGGAGSAGGAGFAGAGGTPPQVADACAAMADSYCTRLDECAPGYLVDFFSDVAACKSIEQRGCAEIYGRSGMRLDPAEATATAAAMRTAGCGETLDAVWTALHAPGAGTLVDGSECTSPSQCASGWCAPSTDPDADCGKCAPAKDPKSEVGVPCQTAGDPPSVYWCTGEGLVCNVEASRCALLPADGEPCLDHQSCAPGLQCDFASNTCKKALFQGEPCDPKADRCSREASLACDAVSQKCTAPSGGAGAQCGGYSQDFPPCGPGLTCKLPGGVNPGNYDGPGTCHARGAEGASCSGGLDCALALSCDGGVCGWKPPKLKCGG